MYKYKLQTHTYRDNIKREWVREVQRRQFSENMCTCVCECVQYYVIFAFCLWVLSSYPLSLLVFSLFPSFPFVLLGKLIFLRFLWLFLILELWEVLQTYENIMSTLPDPLWHNTLPHQKESSLRVCHFMGVVPWPERSVQVGETTKQVLVRRCRLTNESPLQVRLHQSPVPKVNKPVFSSVCVIEGTKKSKGESLGVRWWVVWKEMKDTKVTLHTSDRSWTRLQRTHTDPSIRTWCDREGHWSFSFGSCGT